MCPFLKNHKFTPSLWQLALWNSKYSGMHTNAFHVYSPPESPPALMLKGLSVTMGYIYLIFSVHETKKNWEWIERGQKNNQETSLMALISQTGEITWLLVRAKRLNNHVDAINYSFKSRNKRSLNIRFTKQHFWNWGKPYNILVIKIIIIMYRSNTILSTNTVTNVVERVNLCYPRLCMCANSRTMNSQLKTVQEFNNCAEQISVYQVTSLWNFCIPFNAIYGKNGRTASEEMTFYSFNHFIARIIMITVLII